MKKTALFAGLVLMTATPIATFAQAAPAAKAAVAGGYTVEETDLGTLMDDPAAKAIVDKHMPGLTANPQIEMARSMTLKGVQQYASDKVTDKALADVQADLNKLPKK